MTSDNLWSTLLGPAATALWHAAKESTTSFLSAVAPYSTALSLLLLMGIVYCFVRSEQIIRATKHEDAPHRGGQRAGGHTTVADSPQGRFARVQAYVQSSRESDWRLAVLEADVILDEMVTGMGHHGDSLGEKLKAIEPSDFTTLDKAWEAHAVRNKIAHEGAAFYLTEREAKRVVKLYEEVFREFRYI